MWWPAWPPAIITVPPGWRVAGLIASKPVNLSSSGTPEINHRPVLSSREPPFQEPLSLNCNGHSHPFCLDRSLSIDHIASTHMPQGDE